MLYTFECKINSVSVAGSLTSITLSNCNNALAVISEEIITESKETTLDEYSDLKVYPNPFTDRLRFEFVSPVNFNAFIDIFDITGRLVRNIFEGRIEGGVYYDVEFKPETSVGGIYIYRMTLGEKVYNGKVVYKE